MERARRALGEEVHENGHAKLREWVKHRMDFCRMVIIPERHTDDVNGVGGLGAWHTDQEIVGFDITIDEGFLVDRLHTGNLYPKDAVISN